METSPTLEEQLMEAGNKLLKPPSSIKELLPLLDEAVSFLTKVQQSPAKSVLASLSPLIKALVEDALLRNSNLDVKVALASCLSEITRITAPSVPYGDEKMRSVFELIVSSFENLYDETSRSFKNRALILETVCEVRLWVVMLELKCDELISRMFQYFLKSIREYHPYYIFSSMESIMTAVLEESDDISVNLVTSLLASVRKENEEIKAIGRRLAECVLRNCAFRLKPYVKCAIKSLSLSLDEYSRFVTSVMQGTPIFGEHNNDTSNDPLCAGRQFASSSFGKTVQALGNKEPTVTSDVLGQRSEDANQEDPPVNNELEAEKTPGSQVSKRDERCSLAEYSTEEQVTKGEGITNLPTDETPVEAAKHLEEDGRSAQLFLHKTPENKAAVSLSDLSHTVRDSPVQMTIQPKEDDSLVQNGKEPLPAAFASKKPCEETYDSISCDPGTNVQADTSLEEDSWSMRDAKVKGLKEQGEKTKANKRNGVSSKKQVIQNHCQRTLEQGSRESSHEEEAGSICEAVVGGLKQQVGKTKTQHGRASTEIDVSESSAKDDNNRLLFSETPSMKSAGDDCNEGNQSKSMKRKHTLDKEKVPENPIITYYESLVGSNVQVYMPGDDVYYNGVIKFFDRVKKKHMVWYTHGEEEVLDLKEEVWNIVGENLTERKALDQLYSCVVCNAGSQQIKADKREGVSLKKNGEPKSGQHGKASTEIDLSKSSTKDDNNRLLHSEEHRMKDAEDDGKGNKRKSTKRKHSLGREKVLKNRKITYDESLVGSKIQVYWPLDGVYYYGVIKYFDPVKKMHTVLDNDGRVEVLDLKDEKWCIVSEMQRHRKKESGGLAETSSKHDKLNVSSQRSTEIYLSKSSSKDDNNRLLLSEERHMKAAEDDGREGNKRKSMKSNHSLGKKKVLKNRKITYDESLVGSKIQVHMPLDDVYHDGVIEYFDPVKKTHTVLYNNGEVEALELRKEKWPIVSELQRHTKKENGGLAETSPKHDKWDVSSQRSTDIDLSNSFTKDDNNRLLLCEECRIKAAEGDGIEGNKRKSTKRKHYLGKEKVLKKRKITYDESLVGSKIQVYWPLDDEYYDGVIVYFNHLNKTHKVVYKDGEVEFLRLNEEEWRIVSEEQWQKKKKSGGLAETSSKHGKLDVSSQSNGSQSLGASPKPNGKSKDDTDVDPKSKGHPSKSASTDKSKDTTDNCPTCYFDDEGSGILKEMFCSSSMSKSSKPDASPKTATEFQQDTITTKAMSKWDGNANGGTGK